MDNLDIFSVREINNHIKNILENNIPNLYVEGEITNFVRHSSGHIYFSVKDDFSTLRCVFFKQNNYSLDFFPKNGDKVILFGNISLYVKAGSYQFNVKNIFNSGTGILQIKFEQLKAKLQAEGIFAESHKKHLPVFPKRIGLITSPTGAAIQDIKNVIFRRFPIELVLYPVSVQGDRAAVSLVEAVKYFSENPSVDMIIISRGGGSQEDLFCFNDENLVRAIYDCPIPVISGVGHEIDFTLTDFVADLRAPTPSAAAELAVPDRYQLLDALQTLRTEINIRLQRNIHLQTNRINLLTQNLNKHGIQSLITQKRLQLLEFENTFAHVSKVTDFFKVKLNSIAESLHHSFNSRSKTTLLSYKNNLSHVDSKITTCLTSKFAEYKHSYQLLDSKIESHSPYGILKLGFAYISKEDKLVSSIGDLSKHDRIKIKFYDGSVDAEIK